MTLHELYDSLIPPEKRSLGVIIFISALCHIGVLFAFRIGTFEGGRIVKPRPRVTFLKLGGSAREGEDAARWLDLRDPRTIGQPSDALPEPEYLASNEASLDFDPLAGIEKEEMVAFPLAPSYLKGTLETASVRARSSLLSERMAPMPLVVEAPPALSGTDVQIFGDLAGRKVTQRVALPQPEVPRALGLSVMLLAVNREGWVEFVLIDESCGDSKLDLIAVERVKNWRFAADKGAKEELMWGRAMVSWDLKEEK